MNKKTSLSYKISLILLATCVLFAIASLFTPIITNVTLKYMDGNEKTNIGFYYFFVEGWRNVAKLGEAARSNDVLQLVATQLAIMMISFLIALIIVVYVLVHYLRKYLNKKEEINVKKAFSLVAVATLQYLFIINITNGIKSIGTINVDNSSHFFVGTIFIIISFGLGLTATIIKEYKNTITPENLFVVNTIIVMLMVTLFASSKIYQTYIDGVTESSSIFVFFTDKIGNQFSDKFKSYSVIAIIATLASLIFFSLTFYRFLNLREEKPERILILFSTLYLIGALFSVLFTNLAIKNYLEDSSIAKVQLGTGSYITIVFATLIFISSIFTYLFKNKIIKVVANKSTNQ